LTRKPITLTRKPPRGIREASSLTAALRLRSSHGERTRSSSCTRRGRGDHPLAVRGCGGQALPFLGSAPWVAKMQALVDSKPRSREHPAEQRFAGRPPVTDESAPSPRSLASSDPVPRQSLTTRICSRKSSNDAATSIVRLKPPAYSMKSTLPLSACHTYLSLNSSSAIGIRPLSA
jgi:hypothetical protein